MAAGRSLKSLVGRRRRVDDEAEDEDEGSVMVQDSQSEGSAASDADDDDVDADADVDTGSIDETRAVTTGGSELQPEAVANGTKLGKKTRKARAKSKKPADSAPAVQESAQQQSSFKAVADTEAMMHGLSVEDAGHDEAVVEFDQMSVNGGAGPMAPAPSGSSNGHAETLAERQRREHEHYRKKRDSDPAFIPNRGNFFMHDTRGQQQGQSLASVRGAWAGRGRGRGGGNVGTNVGAPNSPTTYKGPTEHVAQEPWKHDLHDTINEQTAYRSGPAPFRQTDFPQQRDGQASALSFPKQVVALPHTSNQPRVVSFSTTTLVGTVQIRVLLPDMKAPVIFSEVPWKHYIRLPDHRPPLRRDKPVRVSLPPHVQRYIFPSTERSFIFIPRQMRPNQQSFSRGSYQRSVGGYGGHSSRRTSVYGGSVYSGASRRSSITGISRENAFSPHSFNSGMSQPQFRPAVRLPYAGQPYSGVASPSGPLSGVQTPTGMPQIHTFHPPQQFPVHSTPTTTVHQPRPQKTISVTGIESPAALQQAPGPIMPQPFQNQLPPHMNEAPVAYHLPPPAFYSPRQQYNYPHQPQAGTPLSGVPELPLHAPVFQSPQQLPYSQGQQPYYQSYPTQQGYYYSPPDPNGYATAPMYLPPPQPYMLPAPPSLSDQTPHPPQQQPSQVSPQNHSNHHYQQQSQPSESQSGMVAHESNGMVFYMPAAEARQQEQSANYAPAESFVPSYAMPGLPPPTPAPDATFYYPAAQMVGAPPVSGAFYAEQ